MRYEPYEDEYASVPNMSDEELLEYFLYRIAETDEVWGLTDGLQWVTRVINGIETQPVWAFKRYAQDAAIADWQAMKPVAESIEHFMYQILNRMAIQDITVEIMPRTSGVGCLISPQRLFSYLENMRDSSECMVED